MKVLKSKLHILVIAGSPSPDVAAVRQNLAEDEHLAVREFLQQMDADGSGRPLTRTVVDSSDCIVLVGFPTAATGSQLVTSIREAAEQRNTPVLFINGRGIDYSKLQVLEPLLPFTWAAVSTPELFVFPSIPDRQKLHPLITLGGTVTAEMWEQLPPIYKAQTTFRAKPQAEMLAAARLQGIVTDEPLVLLRSFDRRKTFAVTGYGIWRWGLLAQSNGPGDRILPLLFSNVVRWLTTAEENRNVQVTPSKEIFTTTEPADFSGQVYDDELRPVDNADLTVTLARGASTIEFPLHAIGNGRYAGSIEGLSEGDYEYTGRARANGKELGQDHGRVTVGQANVEFLDTKMNKPLLEQIAYRSGGRFYPGNKIGELSQDIDRDVRLSPRETIRTSEIELWNWRYLAAVIVLVFAVEWLLRKRSGML